MKFKFIKKIFFILTTLSTFLIVTPLILTNCSTNESSNNSNNNTENKKPIKEIDINDNKTKVSMYIDTYKLTNPFDKTSIDVLKNHFNTTDAKATLIGNKSSLVASFKESSGLFVVSKNDFLDFSRGFMINNKYITLDESNASEWIGYGDEVEKNIFYFFTFDSLTVNETTNSINVNVELAATRYDFVTQEQNPLWVANLGSFTFTNAF